MGGKVILCYRFTTCKLGVMADFCIYFVRGEKGELMCEFKGICWNGDLHL